MHAAIHSLPPTRRRILAFTGALGGFGIAVALHAATLANPPPPTISTPGGEQSPPPPDDTLPKLVAELAQKDSLDAVDCSRLAQETINHGQAARQTGKPTPPGVIEDGLAAVAKGQAADPKAADWENLRQQLEELLKPPPQQDQQKQDEQEKDEEKKNEQQQQQDQQSNDEKSDDKQQQEQQKQDQKSDDQKKQQQQEENQSEQQKQEEQQQQEKKQSEPEQQQAKPDEQKKETQKIGGEQAPDDERNEHPELAVPLQKLDEVRDQDSPAELFQLLHNEEPRSPDQPKKDW